MDTTVLGPYTKTNNSWKFCYTFLYFTVSPPSFIPPVNGNMIETTPLSLGLVHFTDPSPLYEASTTVDLNDCHLYHTLSCPQQFLLSFQNRTRWRSYHNGSWFWTQKYTVNENKNLKRLLKELYEHAVSFSVPARDLVNPIAETTVQNSQSSHLIECELYSV